MPVIEFRSFSQGSFVERSRAPVFLQKRIEAFIKNARQVFRDELLFDGMYELPL